MPVPLWLIFKIFLDFVMSLNNYGLRKKRIPHSWVKLKKIFEHFSNLPYMSRKHIKKS